ncbi:hypothetical protein QAD02_015722 [Eretmocerus hayati]|uniref:Uncharacterized protein n=1 Tax=Eretmocerus hayati TaxID=131215 RepID=A0ACC2PDU5_9HYME|nr:hypothetical protein QAD02_015722 [Eretmocerus hayati]
MEGNTSSYVSTFRTKSDFKESCLYWTIENWDQLTNDYTGYVTSPTFYFKGTGETFHLRIDLNDDYPTFYLEMKSDKVLEPNEQWYIVRDDDKKELIPDGDKRYKLPDHEEISDFINNDTIIICCDITYAVLSHVNLELVNDISTQDKIYKKKFCLENHGKLYQNQNLCDVTFLLDNKEQVKAHSAVLGAASPFFVATFLHDSKGSSGSYEIDLSQDPDATPKVFRGFLDCIYGLKSVFDHQSIAIEMCILADKYGVTKLQDCCESYLCDEMNEDNIAKILLFSYTYNCNILKERALKFAKLKRAVVKSSPEFNEICKNKELIYELL